MCHCRICSWVLEVLGAGGLARPELAGFPELLAPLSLRWNPETQVDGKQRRPHAALYTQKLPLGEFWRLGTRNPRESGLSPDAPDHCLGPLGCPSHSACQPSKTHPQVAGDRGVFSKAEGPSTERAGSLLGEVCPSSPAFWVAPAAACAGFRPGMSVMGQTWV